MSGIFTYKAWGKRVSGEWIQDTETRQESVPSNSVKEVVVAESYLLPQAHALTFTNDAVILVTELSYVAEAPLVTELDPDWLMHPVSFPWLPVYVAGMEDLDGEDVWFDTPKQKLIDRQEIATIDAIVGSDDVGTCIWIRMKSATEPSHYVVGETLAQFASRL